MGKSVGDMYKGRLHPRLHADRFLYAGYVICWRSSSRSGAAHAARSRVRFRDETQRQDRGLTVAAGADHPSSPRCAAAFAFRQEPGRRATAEGRRWIVWTKPSSWPCAALLAFVVASVNKVTRLGLLSHGRTRTFVLIPPLLLIFRCWAPSSGVATPPKAAPWAHSGAQASWHRKRGRLSFSAAQAGQSVTADHQAVVFVVFILVRARPCSASPFQGVDGPLGGWNTC